MNIFPWQDALWQQLLAEPDNLPHAILLAGPAGFGKLAFAQAMAASLLCEAPRGESQSQSQSKNSEAGLLALAACGSCSSCNWFAVGNHPDIRIVQPEASAEPTDAETVEETEAAAPEKPKSIKTAGGSSGNSSGNSSSGIIRIDQIRALTDFVFIGSHRLGRRIVVLSPAEAMNPAAANALLKILEEPPASVCFILVSHAWRKLLPTIRSRCRVVAFGRPDPECASRWLASEGIDGADELLQLAGGAPLQVRDWVSQGRFDTYKQAIDVFTAQINDPVMMAMKWSALIKADQGFTLVELVEAAQKWVFDLVQMKIVGQPRYHMAWQAHLLALATRAGQAHLLACYSDLLRIRAVARHPLNAQLFLEDMAARYVRAVSVR